MVDKRQSLEFFYDGRFKNDRYHLEEIATPSWPKGREDACVKWVPGGDTLLEIGFGEGNLLYSLSKRFKKAYGVEVGTSRIGPMTQAFREKGCENVFLSTANVEKSLPFENETFDCIIWLDVIEHVVDIHAAMDEINRVLKPNGMLITSTPNIAEIRRRMKLLLGTFPSTAYRDHEGFDLTKKEPYDRGHLHYFTHSGIDTLYKLHGIKSEKRYGFGTLGRFHNFRPSLLCGTIFAIGRKI
jgi:SAM-dependent methyltransferase